MKRFATTILIIFPLFLYSQTLKDIKNRNVLKVAFTKSGKKTVNRLAAQEFAKFLDVDYKEVTITWDKVFANNGEIPSDYTTNPKISYVPDALKEADIICGTIYMLDWRKKFFNYAGVVQISDLIIVREGIGKEVRTVKDLKGLNIAFLENSTYETEINKINKQIGGGIKFTKTSSEDKSLQLLKDKKVDGLIAVSYLALSYVSENKSFKLAFPVVEPSDVGWVIRTESEELKTEIDNFFETIKGNGKLDKLFRKKYKTDYSTYIEIINSYSQLQSTAKTRDLDDIINSGKIIIALRDREMVYHKSGKKQFNHYLAEKFAKFIGVLQYEIKITDKLSKYFENEEGLVIQDSSYTPEWFNEFDVACDLLAPLDERLNKIDIIDFMPDVKVVIGKKKTKINSVGDLQKLRGVTSKNSSYEYTLSQNNITNFYYNNTDDNFFRDVISGKADYTISNIAVFNLVDYPELEAKFVLGELSKMGWAIKKNHPRLRQKVLEFFEYAEEEGIFDKYFKRQTGMTMQAAQNYLTALHETYKEGYFPFVYYGTETGEGLPQEDILAMFQDKEGYMWFGTHNGVAKYNGRNMKIYNTENKLAGNSVYGIKQDNEQNIYFATKKGISVLDKFTDKITNYFNDISFRNIFVDSKNNKWFYGDEGIFTLREEKETNLNLEISNLPVNVNSISEKVKKKSVNGKIKKSTFAIATESGLYILDKENIVKQIYEEYCHYTFFDSDGNLWTSTQSGLYFAKKNDLKKSNIGTLIDKVINLPNNIIIREIMQTKDGSIWLISDYKVFQILTIRQKPIVYDKNIGLKKYKILSFLLDNEQNLWFGFSGGTQKLTNKSIRTLYPELLDGCINSIFTDKYERIWLGMNNDIFYLKEKLVNFSKKLNTGNKSFVVAEMPDKDIVIANLDGIYLIDAKTLRIKKTNKFKNLLFALDDIFISDIGEIFLLTGEKGIIYRLKNINSNPIIINNKFSKNVFQLENVENKIIGGNNSGLIIFKNNKFSLYKWLETQVWSLKKAYTINPETFEDEIFLWVGTQNGLGIYKNNKFKFVAPELFSDISIKAITSAEDKNKLWLGTDKGVIYYNVKEKKIEFIIDSKDGLLGNEITTDGLALDGRGLLWTGTFHGVSTFDITKKKTGKNAPICRIESIILNGKSIAGSKLPSVLEADQGNLVFEISGLSFKDEKSVEYEFYMQGLENDYAASRGSKNIAEYTNLPSGKYSFKYRTKGKDGIWSYYQSINFSIMKPFYLEWWFLLPAFIIAVILVWLIFKWRLRVLKKRNEQLEEIVTERTAQIREKNAELKTQKKEIQEQRDKATHQRDEISHQKKEIEDSILYAKRIQNAILPPNHLIDNLLPENFILFKPRDIVSGDYYWVAQKNDSIYFAVADCTGHGVPGAFMSMLGISFLNEIVSNSDNAIESSAILNRLRRDVIKALHQTGEIHEAKDGMDIALCKIDMKKMELEFSGAFNPMYIIRNDELQVVTGDRMPIGIYEYSTDNQPFTNKKIKMQKGDIIYLFSDGYPDQFGGPKEKKFMISRFKNVLLKAFPMPMYEQRKLLDETIERWRDGVSEQIDDILVMGVKV